MFLFFCWKIYSTRLHTGERQETFISEMQRGKTEVAARGVFIHNNQMLPIFISLFIFLSIFIFIHKDKIKIHKRDGGAYIHTNQMLLSLKTAAVLRCSTAANLKQYSKLHFILFSLWVYKGLLPLYSVQLLYTHESYTHSHTHNTTHTHSHTQTNTWWHTDTLRVSVWYTSKRLKSKYLFQDPIIGKSKYH